MPPEPPPFQNRRTIDTPQFQKLEQKADALAEKAVRFDERTEHLEADTSRIWQAILLIFTMVSGGIGIGVWWTSVASKAEVRELRKEFEKALYGTPADPGLFEQLRAMRHELEQKQDKTTQEEAPTRRRTR